MAYRHVHTWKEVEVNGDLLTPSATLEDEYGGVAHIVLDCSQYILIVGDKERPFRIVTHWFDEAIAVLGNLPPPSEAARSYMKPFAIDKIEHPLPLAGSGYVLQSEPWPDVIVHEGTPRESRERPVATLIDRYGQVAHIVLDDRYYGLVIGIRVRPDDKLRFVPKWGWFDEAVDALRTLPNPGVAKAAVAS